MKLRFAMSLALPVLVAAAVGRADELKSGLPVGKSLGPFDVTKCAGAPDDGVKVGQELCYR
jgi:hypothetical protein